MTSRKLCRFSFFFFFCPFYPQKNFFPCHLVQRELREFHALQIGYVVVEAEAQDSGTHRELPCRAQQLHLRLSHHVH